MNPLLTALLVLFMAGSAFAADPGKANAYIISPEAGQTVSSPVTVVFGLAGFGVAPAGTMREGTGHHHLIIDSPLPDLTKPIPADSNHVHFGGGQTEVTVDLASGKHTLQLLLGDHSHVPHDPPIYSDVVTINVK